MRTIIVKGQMAESAKCMLCKRQHLSSIPHTLVNPAVPVLPPNVRAVLENKQDNLWGLLACQPVRDLHAH